MDSDGTSNTDVKEKSFLDNKRSPVEACTFLKDIEEGQKAIYSSYRQKRLREIIENHKRQREQILKHLEEDKRGSKTLSNDMHRFRFVQEHKEQNGVQRFEHSEKKGDNPDEENKMTSMKRFSTNEFENPKFFPSVPIDYCFQEEKPSTRSIRRINRCKYFSTQECDLENSLEERMSRLWIDKSFSDKNVFNRQEQNCKTQSCNVRFLDKPGNGTDFILSHCCGEEEVKRHSGKGNRVKEDTSRRESDAILDRIIEKENRDSSTSESEPFKQLFEETSPPKAQINLLKISKNIGSLKEAVSKFVCSFISSHCSRSKSRRIGKCQGNIRKVRRGPRA